MRLRGVLAVVMGAVCVVVMGVAAPAGAAPKAAPGATCQIADPENITGAMFVNNQFVNGTWNYATGVKCGFQAADIALFEQLNLNGNKVDSKLLGFTGVPRVADAILSQHTCAVCTGTWQFLWGQIVKAPTGFTFTSPPSGCVTVQNGVYLVCVQTKTVTV
jgi:hypothetical protein